MEDETLLARWLAGELNDTEQKELESSPKYATFVRIRENFGRIERPDFKNPGMLEDILKHEKATAAKVVPLYRSYKVMAIAASVVLLLGMAFFFMSPENKVAGYGETLAFALPDQSEVILNAGSEASYRDFNWDSNRKIKLDGEAYFKVAKGQKFEVETALGSVTVLGTQFNVKARESRLDVTCYEGRVSVQYNGKETVITANEGITVNENITEGIASKTAAQPEWLQDELVFDKEKFTGVIAELERHYNINIETGFTSEQLFSGPVPGNDLDSAIRSVSLNYHLTVNKKGNTITLTPINAGK